MKPIVPSVFPWKDHTKYTYPLGLDLGGVAFLSGNSASEYDAASERIVIRGNLLAQIDTAIAKIRAVLEAGTYSLGDVVSMIVYVTPQAFTSIAVIANALRSHGISGAASHVVPVNRLMRRDALIEIEVIASRRDLMQSVAESPRAIRVLSGGDAFVLVGAEDKGQRGQSLRAEVEYANESLKAIGMDWSNVARCRLVLAATTAAEIDEAVQSVQALVPDLPVMPSVGFAQTPLLPAQIFIEVCLPHQGGNPLRASHGGLVRQFGSFLIATGLQSADEGLGLVQQVEQIYGSIVPELLSGVGMDMSHIVQTVEWVTEESFPDYRQTAAVRRELLRDPFPVASGLVCSVLPNRRKVSVDIVASKA